ncbi:hypothetical protein KGP26_08385 [Serratia sp. JSRIV002]|uniref:hypothetical protein n=1 Tax=Serratia TaxID=613 RepID=UPI000BA27EA8|nr:MULTISPECIES: hypothetical protein [Serratia]PAA96404.1 hypothetical protein CJJ13_17590 [Serratia fonticola]UAN53055.1 hypothetical protein KGP26_08385 [Serratia sp. JSRIV002]
MKVLVRPDFKALNTEINSAGKVLSAGDFTYAHEVLDRLNNDSKEVELFSKDPKAYLQSLGFSAPEGIEGIYYIDGDGVVHPHAHDKPSSGQGARVVAEVYKEPGILGWCAICMGCVNN